MKVVFVGKFFLLMMLLCVTTGSSQQTIDTLSLKIPSEGHLLDVKIVKPKEVSGQLPAILFLVGSKESSLKGYKTFTRHFLESLATEGHAVLIYFDKRGIGESEGVWYDADFFDRALDAKNVALGLSNFEFIDTNQIYLTGHSQGGWITQLALAQYPEIFKACISMAGPVYSVKQQILNDYYSSFKCEGLSDEKALKKAKRKLNKDLTLVSLFGFKGNAKQLRVIKKYEPKLYLQKTENPLLLLFGENDMLVSPEWNEKTLQEIFPSGRPKNITVYTAPGENHSFLVVPPCYTKRIAPEVYSDVTRQYMKDWL